MVSAGLVGAVGNRVRVGRPGCTGSIHSDFTRSLCTVFAKLLLLNVWHKIISAPVQPFTGSDFPACHWLAWAGCRASPPGGGKRYKEACILGSLPTCQPSLLLAATSPSLGKNKIPLTTTMQTLLAFMVGSCMAMSVIKIPYTYRVSSKSGYWEFKK